MSLKAIAMSSMVCTELTELKGQVMNYAWGKLGDSSFVSKLASRNSGSSVEPNTPYAELWIGTHPNAPTTLKRSPSISLLEYLKQTDPNVTDLPFLMKVLSVAKPLSIQAHPDRDLAKELFQTQPNHYKDANHKPEMAIALTPFQALFGFRSIHDLRHHFLMYPELAACTIFNTIEKIEAWEKEHLSDAVILKSILQSLFQTPKLQLQSNLSKLVSRLKSKVELTSTEQLFLDVHEHFPGDIGTWFVFLMNHVTLQPGQALFMGANELHAYLSGDCVEVMATSDNVVRAGLTSKHKDVPRLLSMLNYTCRTDPKEFLMHPISVSPTTVLYDPPIQEFSVYFTQIDSNATLPILDSCISLALVTQGQGCVQYHEQSISIAPGSIFFIPKGVEVKVQNENKDQKIHIYQSFCNA